MRKLAQSGRRGSNSQAKIIACLFLGLVFACGGASRPDVSPLALLRPCAAIVAIWSLSRLSLSQARWLWPLLAVIGGGAAIAALQLIPMPFAWWRILPGHEAIASAASAAGLTAGWFPVSLTPSLTWNAFFSLFVPLAVVTAGARLSPSERYSLAGIVFLFGSVSALVAVCQAAAPDNPSLYFYSVTNHGAPVGLMANRDHQAVLLAVEIPILAVLACRGRDVSQIRLALTSVGILFLCALIMVSGSRAGMALGLLCLLSIPVIMFGQSSIHRRSRRWLWVAIGTGATLLCLTVMLAGRALSIDRLASSADDMRFLAWPLICSEVKHYFPLGSGLGSFGAVFQIDEPNHLLRPTYLNHAHNEWLESALTGGLPAIGLLCFACYVYFLSLVALWRSRNFIGEDVIFARLGIVVVTIFAFASLVDFPLRTPALISVFTLAAIWTATGLHCMRSTGGSAERAFRRFPTLGSTVSF